MSKQKVDGMTPEEYFVYHSKKTQAEDTGDIIEWDYRELFVEEFGFKAGWAYEKMKQIIEKYVKLGQITVEKIWYSYVDGKRIHDRLIKWKPEFLPKPKND